MGTVGKMIPNMEDARGCGWRAGGARATRCLPGYWQNEEATKKEFTEDGWFKTGDIGKIEDGFLSITDRKKELLKTSGGKYVAPQPSGEQAEGGFAGGAGGVDWGQPEVREPAGVAELSRSWRSGRKKNGVNASDHAAKLVKDDPKVQKAYEGDRREGEWELGAL